MYKLLFFDLDGTLADSIEAIREGINIVMESFGYPSRSYEDIRRAIGNGARRLVARSMPKEASEDEALVDRVLATYDEAYATTYLHTEECYDGILPALRELKKRGYLLCVLSNKQDAYVRGLCSVLLDEGMLAECAGQTEKPKKPSPAVPLEMAERLGILPSECAFIGDSEVDILTAKNAGMLAVGVTWGYREEAVLREAQADAILHRPEELLSLFPPLF